MSENNKKPEENQKKESPKEEALELDLEKKISNVKHSLKPKRIRKIVAKVDLQEGEKINISNVKFIITYKAYHFFAFNLIVIYRINLFNHNRF